MIEECQCKTCLEERRRANVAPVVASPVGTADGGSGGRIDSFRFAAAQVVLAVTVRTVDAPPGWADKVQAAVAREMELKFLPGMVEVKRL